MPQFILDHGSSTTAGAFRQLDGFTQGYIEAMFFTETGSEDDGDLEHATVADLTPSSWEAIRTDCEEFQAAAASLLAQAYDRDGYDEEAAGRDFWFTRNGHGVGFWEREPLREDGLGDALSALCGWRTQFPERNLEPGDDGLAHYVAG